jgi:glycosyltransferase involved in cell wall biosynthesis
MQQLKILFYLLGDRSMASSRVRGFWMAEALERLCVECSVVYGQNRISLLHCLARMPGHDVVYFQKNCSKWHVRLMEIANAVGKKTFYDLDDAPSRINSPVTLRNARKMMTRASAVVAGSQALLDYSREYQPNSFFLPTSIKLENYVPIEKVEFRGPVCLGWIGNGAHYGNDLVEILSDPLKIIGSQQRVRFIIVGACGNKQLYEAFSDIPGIETVFVDQICWSDPLAVQNHLAEFDIGLYPVLDNEFNRHKCGLKALEYMAMQIPVIISPVGANKDIVAEGIDGYHANDTKEWVDALEKLITDPNQRKKFGQAGRRKIKKQYSISESARKLAGIIEALNEAKSSEKKMSKN